MIKMTPKLLSNYNCFQSNVLLASEYFNRRTYFLFSASLNFIYHQEKVCIGEKLTQYHKNPINEMPLQTLEFMSLYDGISLVPYRMKAWNDFIESFGAEEKKGYPLILSLCDLKRPWREITQDFDLSKFILIIQINNGVIYYLDPFKTEQLHSISISLVKDNLELVNYWKFTLNTNIEKMDINKVISFHNEFFKKNYYITDLIHFANDIQNLFNYEFEIGKYENINDVPMIVNLRQIFINRKSFLEYLVFLKNNVQKKSEFYETCTAVYEAIQKASVLWDNLILQLIRKKIQNKTNIANTKLADIIYNIYAIEKEAVDLMIKDY